MANSDTNDTARNPEEEGFLPIQDIPQPLRRILHEAFHENASDIHFDPVGNEKVIRYRVDGVVHEKERLGMPDRARLVNQVKVNSGMVPDRTVAPQEGLMLLSHEDQMYDVRVTLVPVLDREAVHLRFVASKGGLLGIDELGLCESHRQVLREHLDGTQGLILLTGATGSGKTTTMYALVSSMDLSSQVVASIEDPVEFRIPYLRQVQVDMNHGLSMQEGLRTLLRMDPEGIVIGEVRDQNSAMIAGRASLTGRLVLATLHAPTAATAVSALQNLAVPKHVLGHALRLVLTQDLVPRLCPACRHEVDVTPDQAAAFEHHGLDVPACLFESDGCDTCHQYGHAGRVGVFELLKIDREAGYALAEGLSQRELATMFRRKAGHSMMADALSKAAEGSISFASARRLRGDDGLR